MKFFDSWLKQGEREIDILGEKWTLKVEPEPRIIKGTPEHGECNYQEKHICVWCTGDIQRDVDTLLHELLHVIRIILGLQPASDSGWQEKDYQEDRDSHSAIHPVASGLAYIFTHNKIKKTKK